MKKAISMLLVLALCLSLCACGKSTSSKSNANVAQNAVNDFTPTQTESVNANDSLIEFENVVLVDNDTVKIELVNFYAEDVDWYSDVQNEKYITVKATNKSNHDIALNPGNFYLGDEAVVAFIITGSIAPAPGKSGNYTFMIKYNTSPESTALDSLEELYALEGSFDGLNIYEDSSKNTWLSVNFNIQSAINGEIITDDADALAKDDVLYEIGDTVSTDMVEFTLTGFDYVYHLKPSNYAEKEDNSGGSLGPGTDMVFANPEYTVTNISQSAVDVNNVIEFSADYKDGYIFNMYDGVSYMRCSSLTRKITGRGSSTGVSMALSPLSTDKYEMYFAANALIETDTSSTLLLRVILDSTSGEEEFVFKIR